MDAYSGILSVGYSYTVTYNCKDKTTVSISFRKKVSELQTKIASISRRNLSSGNTCPEKGTLYRKES